MKYAVWPTPVVPVTTRLWTQEDWAVFEDRYRPAGYTGGMYDQVAWNAYQKVRQTAATDEVRLRWYASILKTQGQTAADQWLRAARGVPA